MANNMDNGTMVEIFKYLNYCQLAKSSLISKRIWNLIQTHRHKLTLLFVYNIEMRRIVTVPAHIEMFDKMLSPEAYNEWIVRNNYTKRLPREGQADVSWILKLILSMSGSTQNDPEDYELVAKANYKNSKRAWGDSITVIRARAALNHEYWPLYQHFIRLLTDPFVFICHLQWVPQNDVLNFLTRTNITNRNRLQCEYLTFNLPTCDDVQKYLNWTKTYMLCDVYQFHCDRTVTCRDEELLDFFLTAAPCTSEINVKYYEPYKVIIEFVKKFMDLESWDEKRIVESIKCNVWHGSVDELKRKYEKFIVNEESDQHCGSTTHIFEFDNDVIGKKLQLTAKVCDNNAYYFHIHESCFVLKIENM
ncbi:hypothetical protein DdX_15745 [Ditylenchus destructor]|uniref:F-box domain-containing protein n=1 Tax=Ditylenchus destructor TaxID=166010 RepID=A0AAD4MP27_9BILA|nr:hypothetical protein DdX_15745 [Ditylenchus destructor]